MGAETQVYSRSSKVRGVMQHAASHIRDLLLSYGKKIIPSRHLLSQRSRRTDWLQLRREASWVEASSDYNIQSSVSREPAHNLAAGWLMQAEFNAHTTEEFLGSRYVPKCLLSFRFCVSNDGLLSVSLSVLNARDSHTDRCRNFFCIHKYTHPKAHIKPLTLTSK